MSNIGLNIVPSFYLLLDLITVRTITPVHVGAGRTSGIVDLPIQRDEYGYSCIYSSSLKGSLKTALLQALLRETNDYAKAKNAVQVLLGPEPEEGEAFESSITILDAYLLAIPVRSLKGIYVYVTSPLLIKRFYERFELFKTISQGDGQKTPEIEELANMLNKIAEQKLEPFETICIGIDGEECDKLRVKELEGKVVLAEEYFLDLKDKTDDKAKILSILKLDKPLLIVSDENETAKNIVERSILRFTRVRLGRETKTVGGGPWTEEYLPPKTILHTMILYKKPQLSGSLIKKILDIKELDVINEGHYLEALKELNLLNDEYKERISKSNNILGKMRFITESIRMKLIDLINGQLKGYVILGGHETIGKGITKLEILGSKDLQKSMR